MLFIFGLMGKIAKGFRILYQAWLILLLALLLIILYPFYRIFLKRGDFDRVYRTNRWVARFFSKVSFIPCHIQQVDELPPSPYIICANHASYLDILFLMIPFRERFVFLGKQEILDWPYFSMFFRSMNVPVPRGSRKVREAYMQAGKELDKGIPIAMFPEGTIPTEAPDMGDFKTGAFRLSLDHGVPIVPVTFLDNWWLFPEGEGFWGSLRPGRARIVLNRPVYPEGRDVNELSTIVRERINEGWQRTF